ncbi:MAG: hypothetical protein OHK0012_26680 [Synechococcales cyanobacterium]
MQERLYLEIPTPETTAVLSWLQQLTVPADVGTVTTTPTGVRIERRGAILVIFCWSLMNTTYVKVVQWSATTLASQQAWLSTFTDQIRQAFPAVYPQLPTIDLSSQTIFAALAPHYPLTVEYFQRIPNGESDLQRVYWWEQRWRSEVQSGFNTPRDPVVTRRTDFKDKPEWDLIVVGGALGSLYAAAMAVLGYRVVLLERLPFGRMNREWNISRLEWQTLVDVGLFTDAEVDSLILREYRDGFNKFFDAHAPIKAPVLHTPTVLNLAINAERLLHLCGEKILQHGGQIIDACEFVRAEVGRQAVRVEGRRRESGDPVVLTARLLVDAMGTASPIAQQLYQGQAFQSVCPTVGAVIQDGFAQGVWDSQFGDILASHGDISRGRQLIWELFPGPNQELTFYLFHYHQVHPENPGSLLELYEDFFTILPEYRRCDLDQLQWKKATFGYIPGRFHMPDTPHLDRVLLVGDAAAMQSPLSFTGFGSLVRNLPRLMDLSDTALRHDLVQGEDLRRIRAYQGNAAITWLFSRGMMVPTGMTLPPGQVNAMLNSFFDILAAEPPQVADSFIKDRAGWWDFNRMAVRAAVKNPRILLWIWQSVGWSGFRQWIPDYLAYSLLAILAFFTESWLPWLLDYLRPTLESRWPRLWLRWRAWSYTLSYSMGRPRLWFRIPSDPSDQSQDPEGSPQETAAEFPHPAETVV